MESPEYVRISLAAAMTLGFAAGRFRRNAQLTGLNLLLTYQDGCLGRCSYCGLAGDRQLPKEEKQTFIRVDWPVYSMDEIIARTRPLAGGQLKRACVSMITHRRAFADMNLVIGRVHGETCLPVSALVSPTMLGEPLAMLAETRAAGADMIGIAVDAATPDLFDQHRQHGVGGPHRWAHFWECVEAAAQVFGPYKAGVHLIVGLEETEQQMIETIQRAQDMGAHTHLFSFFPEGGTSLSGWVPPTYGHYRRVQLARAIINDGLGRADLMAFNAAGQVVDFGVEYLDEIIDQGVAFMTSGCPGADGMVACNRPFGNERPSSPFRNYPFLPDVEDIALIRLQLQQGLQG